MFMKIPYTYNSYRTYMQCQLEKKILAEIKLTNKLSEIKQTEVEQFEQNQAKSKPFDTKQNEPVVMIQILIILSGAKRFVKIYK